MHHPDQPNLIGKSLPFIKLMSSINSYASCDATVMIHGETGTGKELAARAIHNLGPRADSTFVPINCGALPDYLLESELFGHCRGAFTDARETRFGLVEAAKGGTLFLDEVEAMSTRLQTVLLRFLENKEYRSVGGNVIKTADVRIIAASNCNLLEMIQASTFRKDLFYRLNILTLDLPPLRQRKGDIELLAKTFIERLNMQSEISRKMFDPESFKILESYDWPGNIRELENLIYRVFHTSSTSVIKIFEHDISQNAFEQSPLSSVHVESIPPHRGNNIEFHERRKRERRKSMVSVDSATEECSPSIDIAPDYYRSFSQKYDDYKKYRDECLAKIEKAYLKSLMSKARGNMSQASRISGKDRSDLCKLLKKHNLFREDFSAEFLLVMECPELSS